MLTCLKDYIGLRGVVDSPASDMFVDTLPRINAVMVLSAGKAGTTNPAEIYSAVQDRAIITLSKKVISLLREQYVCLPISREQEEADYVQTLEDHICANPHLVDEALWYLLGAELLTELLNSPKANIYTLTKVAGAEELKDSLYAEYRRTIAALPKQLTLAELFKGHRQKPAGKSFGWSIG